MRGIVAHDFSAKLISVAQLPQPLTIRVPFYDEDETPPPRDSKRYKEYTLTIKFTKPLDLSALREYAFSSSSLPETETFDSDI